MENNMCSNQTPDAATKQTCRVVTKEAPLRGDGQGHYKVVIVGNSGVGKSTLAAELATLLGVPLISLDMLFWQPDWKTTPSDEFRDKVRRTLDETPNGWVIDGVYNSRLGSIVDDASTDIIWLDPPLILYFPRICLRTLLRLLRIVPPCSPGCLETFSEVFSSRSILWFCLSNHWRVKKRQMELYRVDNVWAGGKRRRIGGFGGELRAWKKDVKDMVAQREREE